MSEKVFCDRCGKEKGFKDKIFGELIIFDRKNFDLCGDCFKEFIKWLKTKPSPHDGK